MNIKNSKILCLKLLLTAYILSGQTVNAQWGIVPLTSSPADPEITAGTVIGTNSWWQGSKYSAFDNNTSVWCASAQSGAWVGKDLGAIYNITAIHIWPYSDFPYDSWLGGMFQTSADANFTNPSTFYTTPDITNYNFGYTFLANTGTVQTRARYIRYTVSPLDHDGVIELKFYGTVAPVSQTLTGNINTAGFKAVGAANSNNGLSVDARGNVFADSSFIVTGTTYAARLGGIYNESVPDYVFDAKYPLQSLAEIGDYTKHYKHLPGVPSDADYKKKGSIDVMALNLILLKKIEELTLHIIELDKKTEGLEKKALKQHRKHRR